MTLMLLMGSYEYKRIYLTSSLDAHIPLVRHRLAPWPA
jgi:hypothetical protein